MNAQVSAGDRRAGARHVVGRQHNAKAWREVRVAHSLLGLAGLSLAQSGPLTGEYRPWDQHKAVQEAQQRAAERGVGFHKKRRGDLGKK